MTSSVIKLTPLEYAKQFLGKVILKKSYFKAAKILRENGFKVGMLDERYNCYLFIHNEEVYATFSSNRYIKKTTNNTFKYVVPYDGKMPKWFCSALHKRYRENIKELKKRPLVADYWEPLEERKKHYVNDRTN